MSKLLRLSRSDFVSESGASKRFHGRFFSLSASSLPGEGSPLLACVVSKKTAAKAVERNLIKRLCREAVRAYIRKSAPTPPLALVFRAKKDAVGTPFTDILRDVGELIDKISDTRYNTPQ